MVNDDIKRTSIKGITWSFVESSSSKIIQFVINVIMARLLLPEDYGVVAIIFVFITISQIFIDGGFATSLVQIKNKNERDYSTIYTFNIIISIICYVILFISAPNISSFYHCDITLYFRVQCITLVIFALSAIHRVKLIVAVNFKKIAQIGILSSFLSGIIGVSMAYVGFGIWALISQSISNSIIQTILLIYKLKWKPVCFFNQLSFKKLFPFGARLLMANLIDRIYQNLYPILVGKFYSATDLGYYSRAEQFSVLPAGTCSDILLRVSFPIMSSISDDEQLKRVYRKYVILSSYLIFPVMFIVILLAKPLILVLLTEKWESIVPLLQILCFGFLFDHISSINRNLIYVKGRADLVLRLEIIKKTLAICILLASIPLGLIGLCIGKALYGIVAMFLNSWYTNELINISIIKQIRDFMPSLLLSIISFIVACVAVLLLENSYAQLFAGGIIYIVIYILLSRCIKMQAFEEISMIIKNTF